MGTFKPKMAASLRSIRALLLHEWDPIGVRAIPEAQDEYDSYAVPLYSVLRQRPSEKVVVDYLYRLETEDMGLTCFGRRHLKPIAQKLLSIDVSADEPMQ